MTDSTPPRVLVVDDENLIRIWLEAHVGETGYSMDLAANAAEAREFFETRPPDAVLLDLRLPDGNGMDLLRDFLEIDPDLVVIVLSAHGDIATAVEAVKLGAHHFLEKPPKLEDIQITLARGLENRTLRRVITGLRRQSGWQFADIQVVGRSKTMERIVELVGKVASSEGTTVLLRGESGVGKEVVAKAIHARSPRGEFPFLEINCTALPESLLESELFGHEKGAFTDAKTSKQGLLELADRGTVLLDEIGDLPLGAQAKLLRFLETRTFKRVGGIRNISVNVRILASTNRDLEQAMRDGLFRQDLFFRLNVVPISIPPLRERPEDIEPLTAHFLERIATALRRPARGVSNAALAMLERYSWPGNVRELKNALERVVILEDGREILPEHLPEEMKPGGRALDLAPGFRLPAGGINLEELERNLIEEAIGQTQGNKTRAAELLGLSRDTLRYRLEKYGIADQ